MPDRGLDGLFESLGATFEAAVAREEEIAAADLAVALLQDQSLRGELLRHPGALVVEGWGSRKVSEVGLDYLGAGWPVEMLVPSAAAVVARVEGQDAPNASPRALVEELRSWARAGRRVRVRTWQGDMQGRLVVVGRDYVVLRGPKQEELAIGLKGVLAVRIVHGD